MMQISNISSDYLPESVLVLFVWPHTSANTMKHKYTVIPLQFITGGHAHATSQPKPATFCCSCKLCTALK